MSNKPKWYYDTPTDKQILAIEKLSPGREIPKTKGECSELLKVLIDIAQHNRIFSGYGAFADEDNDEVEYDYHY
jgi:hypothetical protein